LFQSGSISEEKSANSIVTLREGSASDDRITLELGCLYLNYRLKNLIVQFNQTDPDYRIKVTEYAPGYPEVNLDLDTALMKMNTDLIAGNIPDILCLNEEMPFSAYAARGLFEDLTPYLSAEPEYKLVKAAETALKSADGKLYRIAKAFDILTYVGDSEIVGDEPGWTFKDVDSALASNPGKQLFLDSATQSSALNVIIRINLPDYIDWSTGDVNIDSPDFIKLLEWAKSFPTGKYTSISSVPGYSDGELLGMSTKIDSFKEFLVYNAITEDRISFKGFPSDTRQGSTLWVVDTPLSMSAKCSHKDGAWRFMKNILTEEYYCPPGSISMGFPIVQSIFDNEIQKAMTENYDERNIITRYFYDTMGSGDNGIGDDKALNTDTLYPTGQITIYGETEEKYIEFYAMTEQQIERFMEFLNSITRTMEYDQTLADIVTEECAAFFAGDKSAEETARLIQSRVLIYVNEQM
jgi:ABC-type glycerol-3-phosphate transport system substrate-binding protein